MISMPSNGREAQLSSSSLTYQRKLGETLNYSQREAQWAFECLRFGFSI